MAKTKQSLTLKTAAGIEHAGGLSAIPTCSWGGPDLQQNDRAGLLYTMAGFILLSCGDAVIKSMAGLWAPTAIATLRYALGAAGLSAILLARQGPGAFHMPRPGLQLLRGLSVTMATVMFFSAIFLMPLAETATITFVSPMITALLAPIFLGEKAKPATFIASLAAFAGVALVLRPNLAELGWPAFLPLGCALGMSILFMANRAAAGLASPLAMQAYIAIAATPMLVAATAIGHVSGIESLHVGTPDWSVLARCAIVACSATGAHWLIYMGTMKAGAATVAPMTYVQLIVAVTLGWVFFDERPDLVSALGGAIIVAAGLYLWREGRVKEPAMTD
ncbi:MAG: DMT family transporter [Sphingomonadaceae bacterium]|nr:DMT family transporter [Sphingomonadaceae bacterium]